MMGKIWVGMICISLISAVITGKLDALSTAAIEGAQASVTLCFSIAGLIMFWCGVMEVMRRSGLMDRLTRLVTPAVGLLFPGARRDRQVMEDSSANAASSAQRRDRLRRHVHARCDQHGVFAADPNHDRRDSRVIWRGQSV